MIGAVPWLFHEAVHCRPDTVNDTRKLDGFAATPVGGVVGGVGPVGPVGITGPVGGDIALFQVSCPSLYAYPLLSRPRTRTVRVDVESATGTLADVLELHILGQV